MDEGRPLPAVQRAYFYLVALVAIHMVVLGVANLLRVGAEIALAAPSGGFTGLPFVFNEFNRPADQYREQASLAIALLAVGLPAWLIHFRVAQRAALRSRDERASALRSFYVHLVVFVTAILVLIYGQRVASLVLVAVSGAKIGVEQAWQARAAGAGAMVLSAAVTLAFHIRLSRQDRRVALVDGRAAAVRQLSYYGLAIVGLLAATFAAIDAVTNVWDGFFTPAVLLQPGPTPPGRPPATSYFDFVQWRMTADLPTMLGGLLLWLGAWRPLERGIRAATPDGDVERRSIVRKIAIYLVVFGSAVTALVSLTIALATVGRRLLGDPVGEDFTNMYRELASPVANAVFFGAIWVFHRRVIVADAARETERERAATIRRLYTYLIAALGLAMLAIGAAGTVGVLTSKLMGLNTHSNGEFATYIALVLVGSPVWALSWWQARRRLDDDERRSLPRRGYLYLAVLGGVLGVLVFGSAALYRLLNAALAADFPLATWHDLMHFTVDALVSLAVFGFHLRFVLADRGAQVSTAATHAVTLLVRAVDTASARSRVASLVEGQADISVR